MADANAISAIDIEALLMDSIASADKSEIEARERMDALDALALQNQALISEGQAVLERTKATNAARATANTGLADAQMAVSEAEFPGYMESQQRLYDLSSTQADFVGAIGEEYQGIVKDLLENLNVVREAESMGILDALNPRTMPNFIKTQYQAGKATREAEVQMQQLVTLDAAQQQATATWQSQVSAIQTKAEAKQIQNSALYFREMQSAGLVQRLNTAKAVDDDSMTAIIQGLGLTTETAQNLRSQLSAALQLGDISRQKWTSYVQAAQLQQSEKQFKAAEAEIARDEAMRERFEAKWPQIRDAVGMEYETFQDFNAIFQQGLIPPEQAVLVGNLMTNGVLGAKGALDSTDPATLIDAAAMNGGQSWLTPQFMAMYQNTKSTIAADNASLDPEGQRVLLNTALRDMYQNSAKDVDAVLLPSRGVIQLMPPQYLASADQLTMGLDGTVPVESLGMLRKLNVTVTRNTSFSALARDTIDAVARDKTMDLELMAQAMAGYSGIALRNINQATGFGMARMGSPALGPDGDGTNPSHWYRMFQQRRAELLRPASYAETLRGSSDQNR